MRKRRITTLILALSMMLCGCTRTTIDDSKPIEQPPIIDTSSESNNIPSKTPSNETPSQDSELNPMVPVVINISNYTWSTRLADAIYAKNQDNILFSPLSLNMALGMAEAFAEGNTQKELRNYLADDSYKDFAQQYLEYIKEAYNYNVDYGFSEKYKSMFEIANAMWLSNEYNPSSYAKNIIANYFDGNIEPIDFREPIEACDIINGWAANKTYDMIKQIVSPNNINLDTIAILTNSLYFECAWSESWHLVDEYFTNLDGSQGIQLMSSEANRYYENDKAIAFSKQYANGLTFIGILPNEKGDFNLSDLHIESLLKDSDAEYSNVIAYMPNELNYDCNIDIIKDFFIDNGLSSPFKKAEFRNIVEENEDLYISDILQKCKIELDKNGTRAAAVTAIIMDKANAIIEENPPIVVKLDRPFAYLIYDETSDQILFMGKVITTN